MTGERDDEDLERLLDANRLPDTGTDPIAGLLRAAAAPDPGRALRGQDAAAAAFRTAFTSQPPNSTPRRRLTRRTRTRRATSAILLGVILLVPAALALPRLAGQDPHGSPSLTASTKPLTPHPASPGTPSATPRPLDDGGTLTSTTQTSSSTSAPASAGPDLESGQARTANSASPSAYPRTHHAHTAKPVVTESGRTRSAARPTRRNRPGE